jgi:hypothetical protein
MPGDAEMNIPTLVRIPTVNGGEALLDPSRVLFAQYHPKQYEFPAYTNIHTMDVPVATTWSLQECIDKLHIVVE